MTQETLNQAAARLAPKTWATLVGLSADLERAGHGVGIEHLRAALDRIQSGELELDVTRGLLSTLAFHAELSSEVSS